MAKNAHVEPKARNTSSIHVKVRPDLKEAIRLAADRERRTMSEWVGILAERVLTGEVVLLEKTRAAS